MKTIAQTTVELRNLIKSGFKLFDFSYSFTDQKMKEEIEKHVIDYYYFSEIGQETPDRFKHVFRTTWEGMIGYYDELHQTTKLKYDPLINHKMKDEYTSKSDTDIKTGVDGSDKSKSDIKQNDKSDQNISENTKNSDYPQQSITNSNYLSGAQEKTTKSDNKNDSTTNTTGDSSFKSNTDQTGTANEDRQQLTEGLQGTSYQELIRQEREAIIRIKGMIIKELKPCFMLTY